MSNWDYAVKVPTETWRSAMTTPRKVALKKDDNGYRLISTPVQDLNKYRGTKFKKENIAVNGITKIIGSESIDLASTEINFNLNNLDDKSFTFKLSNKVNDTLLFGYSHAKKSFFIDRKKSGKIKFSEKFANKISYAPRTSTNKNLSGTILIDKTSIELFFDEGETVMTEIFFPNQPFSTFSIETKNRELLLDYIEINQLNIN